MEKSAHIQYVSDEWLIGWSWLRLISTCWQSVCIHEVGGIYLLTPICLRVITVSPSQVGGILIPNRWCVQSTADQLVAATTYKSVLNSKKNSSQSLGNHQLFLVAIAAQFLLKERKEKVEKASLKLS